LVGGQPQRSRLPPQGAVGERRGEGGRDREERTHACVSSRPAAMADLPPALYEADGDLLRPTPLTRGPWNPAHQHAGPPSALLARAVEAAAGIAGGQVARLAVDVLRPVPLEPLRCTARVTRGGRRVEQLE